MKIQHNSKTGPVYEVYQTFNETYYVCDAKGRICTFPVSEYYALPERKNVTGATAEANQDIVLYHLAADYMHVGRDGSRCYVGLDNRARGRGYALRKVKATMDGTLQDVFILEKG